jgi:glyoxylase I family protein
MKMEGLKGIHHIAIICSDYIRSKAFYTQVLGFTVKNEVYRKERNSYKLDLCLDGNYIIELFSFPDPLPRPSKPEAAGLRHLAFRVENIEKVVEYLVNNNITVEPIRIDEYTGRRFCFFRDPDDLPLELYEEG